MKNVLNYKKPAFWLIVVSVVVCVVVAICFLTNSKKSNNPGEMTDNKNEELTEQIGSVISNGINEAIDATTISEVYDSDWSEDKILEEMAKRNPYLEKCTFYDEVLRYIGYERGVRDSSMLFEPILATDTLYYSEDDFLYIKSVSPLIVWLAEYEIYARHGCIFQDEDLNNYFMGQLWYLPVIAQEDFSDAELNACEKKNLMLLEGLGSVVPSVYEGTKGLYYIVGVGGDSLFLDEVEWVTLQTPERAAELGLNDDDMPSGFYIYNEKESQMECSFAEECSFTILDWQNGYRVTKVDKQAFLDMIDSREFLPPFTVKIADGKMVSIWEQYLP